MKKSFKKGLTKQNYFVKIEVKLIRRKERKMKEQILLSTDNRRATLIDGKLKKIIRFEVWNADADRWSGFNEYFDTLEQAKKYFDSIQKNWEDPEPEWMKDDYAC